MTENPERPKVICQFCKASVRTDRLHKHIQQVHKKSVVSCPICKEYVSRSRLRKHIAEVHEKQICESLQDFYGYDRKIRVYAPENHNPLESAKSGYSDHEVSHHNLNLSENRKLQRILQHCKNNQQPPTNSENKTDVVVTITQNRTITLINPSQEELDDYLREYKKWI